MVEATGPADDRVPGQHELRGGLAAVERTVEDDLAVLPLDLQADREVLGVREHPPAQPEPGREQRAGGDVVPVRHLLCARRMRKGAERHRGEKEQRDERAESAYPCPCPRHGPPPNHRRMYCPTLTLTGGSGLPAGGVELPKAAWRRSRAIGMMVGVRGRYRAPDGLRGSHGAELTGEITKPKWSGSGTAAGSTLDRSVRPLSWATRAAGLLGEIVQRDRPSAGPRRKARSPCGARGDSRGAAAPSREQRGSCSARSRNVARRTPLVHGLAPFDLLF